MILFGLMGCALFSPQREPETTSTTQSAVTVPSETNTPEAAVEAQTNAYAAIPFNALSVVAQHAIELPENASPLSLAPNGQWLLVHQEDEICIYATDDFTAQFCQPWLSAPPTSPAWSPDSQRVAFTENALTHFIESDLWVLSTLDGELRNLTDDGFNGNISPSEALGEPIDYAPAFSPDGSQIIFARARMDDAPLQATGLYQIAATGGEAQKLGTLDPEYPFAIYGALYWPTESENVFYSLVRPKTSDLQNGIWQIDTAGEQAAQIVENSPDFGPPMVQAVHPRGEQIIVTYEYGLYLRLAPPNELIFLFNPTNSTTTPFLAPVELVVNTARAAFSPDGSTILYLLGRDDGQFMLSAYDPATRETKVLLEQNGVILPLHTTQQFRITQFFWAENNLVYIPIDGPTPDLLIQLAAVE